MDSQLYQLSDDAEIVAEDGAAPDLGSGGDYFEEQEENGDYVEEEENQDGLTTPTHEDDPHLPSQGQEGQEEVRVSDFESVVQGRHYFGTDFGGVITW